VVRWQVSGTRHIASPAPGSTTFSREVPDTGGQQDAARDRANGCPDDSTNGRNRRVNTDPAMS